MSFVHLIIIQKNTVYNLHAHYRTVQRILEQGEEVSETAKVSEHAQEPRTVLDKFTRFLPGKYKDAGYIIIDHDKKTIISSQDAFIIKPKKGIEIVEV
jgi:hypothetical protein